MMELHRANIEIDYLLQASDAVITRERIGRLKNKSFFYLVLYFIVIESFSKCHFKLIVLVYREEKQGST